MTYLTNILRFAVTTSIGVLISVHAVAQDVYPSRPVTLVIPAAPGGLTDNVGRLLSPALTLALKQPVVVLNKPGAGGAVGAAAVAKGTADGYNVLVAITSLATLPEQEIVNGRPPTFRFSELTPIAAISTEPLMLVAHAESPYRSLHDVIEAARSKPGNISYSSTGVYGTYHVATELFANEAALKLLAVHYKGGGEAMRALLAREVDLSLVSRSVGLAQIKAGKLKPIVAWSQQKWEQFPTMPSLKDEGFSVGYDIVTGLFVAATTPQAIQRALRQSVGAAMRDLQFRTNMEKASASITYLDGPAFGEVWDRESARLNAVIRKIGRIE